MAIGYISYIRSRGCFLFLLFIPNNRFVVPDSYAIFFFFVMKIAAIASKVAQNKAYNIYAHVS